MSSAARRDDGIARARPPSPGRVSERRAMGVTLAILDAAAIRQLQRTAGNRAVAGLLGHPRGRVLHRAMDVAKQFATKALDDEQKALLPRFQAVVNILADEAVVAKHLSALGARIRNGKLSLSEALAEGERGAWAVPRPILIDFAERPTFVGVAGSGQAFEDLVGPHLHGVHTHRIQWHVVRQVLGPEEAVRLYRESLNPRWNNAFGTMWDLIVDANGQQDYTRPEVFLKHLMGLRKGGGSKDLKALGKAVVAAEDAGEKLRVHLLDLYPDEGRLTPAVRSAAAGYRDLMARAGSEPDNTARNALMRDAQKVIDAVRFERVTTVEKDARLTGKLKIPVVWTGWRDVGRSKYREALEARHTLVPTVVYVGVEPGAAPAPASSGGPGSSDSNGGATPLE